MTCPARAAIDVMGMSLPSFQRQGSVETKNEGYKINRYTCK